MGRDQVALQILVRLNVEILTVAEGHVISSREG